MKTISNDALRTILGGINEVNLGLNHESDVTIVGDGNVDASSYAARQATRIQQTSLSSRLEQKSSGFSFGISLPFGL